MGPTWGPSGADRTQVGPMLAPWTLLSGKPCFPCQLDDTIMCHPLILLCPHWWHHDVSPPTAPVIPIYWCVGRLSACCLLRGLPVPHLRVVNTGCMHNWPLSTTDSGGCQHIWSPLKQKNHLSKYRDSHYKVKTVIQPVYLYNGFPCTGMTISLYWNGHLVAFY